MVRDLHFSGADARLTTLRDPNKRCASSSQGPSLSRTNRTADNLHRKMQIAHHTAE